MPWNFSGEISSKLFVNILPVSNGYYLNRNNIIMDLKQNTIYCNPDPVNIFVTFQFLYSGWSRI